MLLPPYRIQQGRGHSVLSLRPFSCNNGLPPSFTWKCSCGISTLNRSPASSDCTPPPHCLYSLSLPTRRQIFFQHGSLLKLQVGKQDYNFNCHSSVSPVHTWAKFWETPGSKEKKRPTLGPCVCHLVRLASFCRTIMLGN